MVTVTVAYTAPINVAGSAPKVTLAQLWTSLERKVRKAEDFVPVLTRTDIIQEPTKEQPNLTIRQVYAKEELVAAGIPAITKEACLAYKPNRVDFHQILSDKDPLKESKSVVQNIISEGAGGAEDLYMTYAFKQDHPDVETGSKEEQELIARIQGVAKGAVEFTLKSVREMVADGRL